LATTSSVRFPVVGMERESGVENSRTMEPPGWRAVCEAQAIA
jgi:hypothetical protein